MWCLHSPNVYTFKKYVERETYIAIKNIFISCNSCTFVIKHAFELNTPRNNKKVASKD
jgi:hypothetical protein